MAQREHSKNFKLMVKHLLQISTKMKNCWLLKFPGVAFPKLPLVNKWNENQNVFYVQITGEKVG